MILKIRNYRNIPFENPIEFELKEGVTFILGPNNIGKTALLRLLYEFREMFQFHLDGNSPEAHFSVKLMSPYDKVIHINNHSHNEVIIEVKNQDGYIAEYTIWPSDPNNTHSDSVKVDLRFLYVGASTTESRNFVKEIREKLSNTLLVGVFRTPEMIATGNSFDLEIGSSFINNWSEWADTGQTQKMQKIKRLKAELKSIFGYIDFDIRTNRDRSNLIVKTDDGEFLLSELGSGIGQFILIMAKSLFSSPSYILIDEPENSLHPRMQEVFVRTIASKAKFGMLAVSHSIGLARSAADATYIFTKVNNIPVLKKYGDAFNPTLAQSLSEMNYSQYAEVGVNNVLLVEGRTDIKFFKEVLKKYGIEEKFIILSLGGGEFFVKDQSKIRVELEELKKLSPKSVSVIFDSEKTSELDELKEKLLSFKNLCEELNFNVFPTDRHSTENYLTQAAVSSVLGEQYSALGPYENFNSVKNKWPKEKNWKAVIEMDKSDFDNTELGEFIEKVLIPLAV